ncbi:MAG: pro-sigmaK processing inhibitor BofA [Peptococcaceae bacterium]|nr:MAG: pro-sigmaK processing inhibitor BofA [Peptococcaceae bacterium]
MEWKMVLSGLVGLLFLYFLGTVFVQPLRFLLRLAVCVLVGGALLAVINLAFGYYGLHVAINPVTLLTAGILQVPGVVLLVLINYFILA